MPAFICGLALCSVELRQRVINVYEAKEGSKTELAHQDFVFIDELGAK